MTDARWAWIEIDLAAIEHNVRSLSGITPSGTRFMAVVKADGYGHGAQRVARAAIAGGASHLGVATVAEGERLRDEGITHPILVLSEPPVTTVDTLLDRELTPSLFSKEFAGALARAASARGTDAPYHLKIDTGMNRVGVRSEDAAEFAAMVREFPGLKLEGTFTHFATADVPNDWDMERQISRFRTALDAMRAEGIHPGIVHAANSPATILYPEAHFDLVRCGIAIYGLQPSQHTRGRVDLVPAMSVKARATVVKRVPMGEGVSYGLTFRAAAPTVVATLPLGYADGVHRVLSNNMAVLVGGRRARQIGRVCMDQLMVEVPRGVEARRGDEFVIVGQQAGEWISMEDIAEEAGTINYEMACSFGMRLPRVYR